MADSLHRKIWIALKGKVTAAQVSGQPLDMVKTNSLFEGVKTTIPSGANPCITMELDKVSEQRHTAPGYLLGTFRFKFHCMIENIKPENQIAAASVFGIVDLVEALKNVLTADQKLGLQAEGVLRVNVPDVEYFVDNYPIRDAMVSVEVQASYRDAQR